MYISVQSPFPSPPAPPPLAATYLLLCSGHVLWMESYNMWPFLCLTFCTLHVFKANPFGSLNQYSFYGWVVNRCRTFPGSSMVKNLPALQETWFSLWVGRSSGGGHGHPLQCSCLENPMDGGAWQATVPRAAKSRTQLKWLSMYSGQKEWSGSVRT